MENRDLAAHKAYLRSSHTTIAYLFLASASVYLLAILAFIVAPHRMESDLTVYYYRWAVSLKPDTSPYPPFVLLIIKPLAYVSLINAFWIWTAINLILFVFASMLLVGWNPMLIACGIFYAPLLDELFWGQSEPILFFALTLAAYYVARERYAFSSAAIAAVGFLKLFPFVVFGYFVAARRWRAVGLSFIAVLAGIALSVAILGIDLNRTFVVRLFSDRNPHCAFCTFWSTRKTDLSFSVGFAYFVGSIRMLRMSVIVSTVGLLLLACYATWKRQIGRDWAAFPLWIAVATAVSPVNEFHHLLLLLIPFAGIVRHSRGREVWLVVLSYALAEVALVAMYVWWNIWESEGQFWIWLVQFSALATGLAASFVATGAFTPVSSLNLNPDVLMVKPIRS
jgi:Glycosyltransferase family 87